MSWVVDSEAVQVEGSALHTTSTSTVRLARGDVDGRPRLRTFGVDVGMLAASLRDPPAWGQLVEPGPCGLGGRAISYLDSFRAGPFGPFHLDVRMGSAPLVATCVPGRRAGVEWQTRDGETETLDVLYKDVSVARLPDGAWLMVAARYRVPHDPTHGDRFSVGPMDSRGDIVAWTAEDAGFTRGLKGPYWMVDSAHALPTAGDVWLGVPGVVVEHERVDLYYVVEPGRGGPGVALKRFGLSELSRVFAEGYPSEESWERAAAIPGELLGRVRVWTALATEGEVRPIEASFNGAGLRVADPAPLACGDTTDLFFGAIYHTGPNARPGGPQGHGVWRAAGVPDGAELCERTSGTACATRMAVNGLDFVVSADDRVITTTTAAIYGDPDPVRLRWGRPRVGVGDFLAKGGPALSVVMGEAGDVCRPWTEAWR